MITDEGVIRDLNFLARTYDGVTDLLSKTKQRLIALYPERPVEHDELIKNLESLKGKKAREIEKFLQLWPLWNHWLEKVPGIGPFLGANLILLYYYAFDPICKKCGTALVKKESEKNGEEKKKKKKTEDGEEKVINTFYCVTCKKSVKGDGVLDHKIRIKDFPNISKWWAYLGVDEDENGKMRRSTPGAKSDSAKRINNWSRKGRTVSYLIGVAFIRAKGEYRTFFDFRRERKERTHPDATKTKKLNYSRHETAKLFLSHMWVVARTLDGLSVTEPYVGKHLKHDIIPPYYWGPGTN